jgi:hypothetical protein
MITAVQLTFKAVQTVYTPLALQGGDASAQWRLLQDALPGLVDSGSPTVSTSSKLVVAAAPLLQARAQLKPWVEWTVVLSATWQAQSIAAMVASVVLCAVCGPFIKKVREGLQGKLLSVACKQAWSVAFLPVMVALVSVFDCSTQYGLRLDKNPTQLCFVGWHILFCILAGLFGTYFVTATTSLSVYDSINKKVGCNCAQRSQLLLSR